MVGLDLFDVSDIIFMQELRGTLEQRRWWYTEFGVFLKPYSEDENCTWYLTMVVRRHLLNQAMGFVAGPRFQHL